MKKAIQLGAGNIGRGFIGSLLHKSGYHVVFADVVEPVVNRINTDKEYTIFIKDTESSEEKVDNISAVYSNKEEFIDVMKEAEILTTAVGPNVLKIVASTIAKGITARFESGITGYFNIIACENALNASSGLKDNVYEYLSDEVKAYADEYIGFPNSSVDRIVPPAYCSNPIDVVVEKYYEWNVQKIEFKGPIPKIEGMNLADNLMSYVERKLFTLNTGHAITAYLGYLKGYKTVDQSIDDPEIYKIVKNAMVESGNALIEKYHFDKDEHLKYIHKIINRFKNAHLKDDVTRVGREPLRKLSPTDRLIKPMQTALYYNLPIDNLIIGVAAAFNFRNQDDPQSRQLAEELNTHDLVSVIKEVTKLTQPEIINKIVLAYNKFQNMD
ncbi:mannitol-1-phosphate 5-dehydrogenase [Candidatus Epulonipiscium fishelsonii]|uniref:Mannitol-1-phosphate 5-dehydrogenase n=1 Tax=Candidatus Epulonipiscium fishelsonii TaxID=77094 RepID=A0ACC8XCC4_9FIRM|nr:mannitol-1-phosphate 5-dehydrogenase [Epulopiscium sp. SCG-B11WGA-EpuloA1]